MGIISFPKTLKVQQCNPFKSSKERAKKLRTKEEKISWSKVLLLEFQTEPSSIFSKRLVNAGSLSKILIPLLRLTSNTLKMLKLPSRGITELRLENKSFYLASEKRPRNLASSSKSMGTASLKMTA